MRVIIEYPDDMKISKLTMETILNLEEGSGYLNSNGIPMYTYKKEVGRNKISNQYFVKLKIHSIYADNLFNTNNDD